jgi:polysaccharide biosynthesis transport protein
VNYVSEPSTIGQQQSSSLREFDLTQLLRTFWRRKNLFAGIVALLMTLAVVGAFAITPLYTAKTDLIIENRERKVADLKAVLGDIMPDKEGLLSELEVIQSRTIAEQVIQQLRLANDPEFNDALKPTGMLAKLIADGQQALTSYLPEPVLAFLIRNDKPLPTEEERRAREYEKVVDAFLKRLGVSVKGQSRAIVIYFTSESPDKAARIANALADAYIVAQLDAKLEATRRANQWLSVKLQDLRKQVAQSEGAVEEYRRRAGLLQSKEGTLISQQVTNLNTQLIVARTERAAADARLDQVRQMVRAAGNAQAAADVLGSPTIQELSRQETEIKRKIADLSQEMGDRHPRLISARAELKDLESKIGAEVNKVVQKLESEAGVARAREVALQRSTQELESRLGEANASEVQLRALERESNANKTLLQQFLSRFEEITAQSDLAGTQTNARILSKAVVPERPSEPKKVQLLSLIFFAASALAAAIVLLVENMDRGFRSGDQIEQSMGVRTLGLVPVLKARRRAGGPQGFVVKNSSSLFGESIRSVYTSILISHAKPAPKTVLLTSSQPKEGKSTLAGCLTRICAISGKRAVLVEADLRKPHVHRLLGVPQSPGLTEFYRGEARLQDILHEDKATGAFVIPSGRLGVDPTMVLGSAQMRELLADLAGEFDLVLVDSPPLMAVSDARLLAPEMDAIIFVVRWGKTHREVVRQSLRELLDTGAALGGIVLSMVDPDKHARYGFGDSGYYYKRVKSYYAA